MLKLDYDKCNLNVLLYRHKHHPEATVSLSCSETTQLPFKIRRSAKAKAEVNSYTNRRQSSCRLFGAAGEQPFIGSTLSSAFPLVNHPAFGALYTAGAGRPEFGGLGSLGMSTALAAHPQLGALSEWWRAAEAHGRGTAAFLPSFIGFPPFFTPHIQPNHSASPVQIRMPGKNSHAPPKGSFLQFFLLTQKPRKKAADNSAASNSESGTSSDSSSDGSLSSDLEDLAEDDEDDDDDDEDDEEEDKHSELSDSEKPLSGERREKKDAKARKVTSNPPTLVPLPCSVSPPALSQNSPLALHGSRSRTEPQQHFSVIQSTGLAANSKPMALLTQPRRESSPSSSPIALTTSPKALASTASPKPPKLLPSSSPQHLPLSLCSSPKPLSNNHSNLFLSSALLGLPEPHHPNGVIQSTTQDAPLALITKPRKNSASQGKSPQCDSDAGSMPVNLSTGASRTQGKGQTPGLGQGQADPLSAWKGFSQNHLVQSLVDLFRGGESGIGIPGVSIPGVGIPGVGIPGTCNPTAGLPANKESDDSGDDDDDEDDDLEEEEDDEDSDDSLSGLGKRKRVMDEKELMTPLELGWRRETRIKSVAGRPQGEVAYYAPCGKKLRQYPDVMKYLSRNGISGITRDNFSFSAKIRVGDFYEAREGPQGLQWSLLKEEEVIPRILAMEGRRGRPPNSERQSAGEGAKGTRRRKGRPPNVGDPLAPEGPSPSEVKLLRKLEAQEIARQAAQMKLMRKLEKQALARAAKEARKQQAIMAAEERRKQKEQIKILKQQEKIKRIQQIRMEKELRAQQILECVLLIRRQHVMLMKAVEARKKAEERERLRQEKRDEKRLNKERKLEQRRLELEIARELKKPNEDMCLSDHKPLPEFSRIPGLILPGRAVSDCLMLMQFLRGFGKVLGLDLNVDVPTLGMLQEGLLNVGDSMGQVQDLLVKLLSLAVCDPGLPPGQKTKTMLGDHLTNVGINRDNVSEVLQMYMGAHCANTELAPLALSLKTKAFQAHTPAQKASILGFLANELACSKAVISEIDKNLDQMANMRKDKIIMEGKLKKLKTIYAKRTGKREASMGVEENQSVGTPSSAAKRKRKLGGDSDDDDDDDDDSDDQAEEDEDEEEEDMKKVKKVETYDEVKKRDLHLQILCFVLLQQHHQTRRKLFEISHSLRSMMYGQDRYRRRYWVLPHCGGVFIEAMESGEGKIQCMSAEEVKVKEEPQEIELQKEKPTNHDGQSIRTQGLEQQKEDEKEHEGKKNSPALFYQQPGCVSKLCTVRDVHKDISRETVKAEGKESSHVRQNGSPMGNTPPTSSPVPSPHLSFQANDQLLRVLTERSGHWFSLLPRNPCDLSSITTTPPGAPRMSPPQESSTPARPKSPPPSPALPLTPSAASASASPHHPAGLLNYPLSAFQVKSGGSLLGVSFGSWPSGMISPSLPLCSSPNPMLGHSLEGNTAASVSSKSESPLPRIEKTSSMPSPALEMPKSLDHSMPRPIPEEMLTGWWRVSDIEELRALVSALHTRGIREKGLQRQMQKYMEIIPQVCTKHKDVAMIELRELEESQVSVESVRGWCVEEQAMEMDIAVLQQVEELERKVTAASLQVKGWTYPDPQSEREDLVYYEHKPPTTKSMAASTNGGDKDSKDSKEHPDERGEKGGLMRHPDNPLDIAVTRLADLERNIERRYLRSPLGTTIQIRLDNVGTVTVPAPAPSTSADREGGEEEVAHGMKVWRRALSEVRSAAQLAMCIQQLQKSIAWERSIMKVYCQMCKKGDNEDLLLLCDGCDKGCHTYCHKPKITSIPEGDWYCPACISKVSESFKMHLLTKGGEAKKNGKQTGNGDVSEDDSASATSTPKKGAKDTSRKRKTEETSPVLSASNQESPVCVKRAKTARDNNRDLGLCRVLLAELERHQDAWPFLTPVNLKSVPGYKKVIKKPMDFSTIREKLVSSQYQNLETFIIDVNLVFDNCEKFNEDNSDIGRAGHNMRKFFEKRWTENGVS
uniref:Bromodomain adjacent to zinc finger domain, 2Ba n=1 Tax=Anabas testudineus TaxID=64144 RepID=A0A7N5ZTA5_ANATE